MIALSLFTSLVKNANNSPVSLIFWHNFDEYFIRKFSAGVIDYADKPINLLYYYK